MPSIHTYAILIAKDGVNVKCANLISNFKNSISNSINFAGICIVRTRVFQHTYGIWKALLITSDMRCATGTPVTSN